ncbi:putative E3 ubiquitin-protein ligase UBR7 [Stigmatopora nigra]
MSEQEQTLSLVDVLQEDQELQEEASAVLAGSDAEHCSYPQGYVKRQALYACNTCTPKGGQAAGVCLACSYKCHEGHDLFELYTKRNFRCDCGNGKFADTRCQLFRDKDEVNQLNKYSHNFFGEYCTCRRPYPDPEDQVEDQMIQCVLCEDWLHGRHLGCALPDGAELHEMICQSCMEANDVLWAYVAPPARSAGASPDRAGRKRSHGDEGAPPPPCRLKGLGAGGRPPGAVFWPPGWRSRLCRCRPCQGRLSEAGLSFLPDESDTVLAYERKGEREEAATPARDPLMSALSNLDRVRQLEIIHGYNDMKSELKDFLQTFAAEGKVVTSEDIRDFFERQQSRKRRRADNSFHCA